MAKETDADFAALCVRNALRETKKVDGQMLRVTDNGGGAQLFFTVDGVGFCATITKANVEVTG